MNDNIKNMSNIYIDLYCILKMCKKQSTCNLIISSRELYWQQNMAKALN